MPHGQCESPIFKRLFQRSGLQRNSFHMSSPPRSRALRPAQSGLPDTTEISRGKIDRLPCTPGGFTPPPLMTMDFAITCSLVRSGRPRYPVFVHRAASLLHASFRPHLVVTPLRFANPSPPSGWVKDFHLQAVDHARHTRETPTGKAPAGADAHRSGWVSVTFSENALHINQEVNSRLTSRAQLGTR